MLDDASGDAAAVTRDYLLEFDSNSPGAPLLSVWGGKITTFRKLAEEAADGLVQRLGEQSPGLDRAGAAAGWGFVGLDRQAAAARPGHRGVSSPNWASATSELPAAPAAALGALLRRPGRPGAGRRPRWVPRWRPACSNVSCTYLHQHEWARSADDVLWRRTKLGLHLSPAQRAQVAAMVGGALRGRRPPRRRSAACS